MFGGWLFVLQLVCTYFMFVYLAQKDLPILLRLITVAFIILQFIVPLGWIGSIIWGGFCWSDHRSKSAGSGL
jgi:hypothetical protein